MSEILKKGEFYPPYFPSVKIQNRTKLLLIHYLPKYGSGMNTTEYYQYLKQQSNPVERIFRKERF